MKLNRCNAGERSLRKLLLQAGIRTPLSMVVAFHVSVYIHQFMDEIKSEPEKHSHCLTIRYPVYCGFLLLLQQKVCEESFPNILTCLVHHKAV